MLLVGVWGHLPMFLFLFYAGYASSVNTTNYTIAQANATINSSAAFVQQINESGYLLFTPNLTQAYAYLNQARHVYTAQPTLAVIYAEKARNAALSAYNAIGSYRNSALKVVSVLTAISAVLLYRLSRPVKKVRG